MPTVGPIKETNVPIVYDTDSGGFGGPNDMRGPEIGTLSYSRQATGNLVIRVKLEFGQPATKYQVFLVCGPAHASSCGFTNIGNFTTNAVGAGAVSLTVPVATLQASPFGPGYRTDHVDFLKGVGDLSKGSLTAGAINYFVCKRPAGAAEPPKAQLLQATEGGDPAKK